MDEDPVMPRVNLEIFAFLACEKKIECVTDKLTHRLMRLLLILGSMASQVQAVEELRREGKIKEGDVGFLFVVGEEVDHIGMVVSEHAKHF